MSSKIQRLLARLLWRTKNTTMINEIANTELTIETNGDNSISTLLSENKIALQNLFSSSADVVYYEFESFAGIKSLVVYINEMVKKEILDTSVLNPFILSTGKLKASHNDKINIKSLFPVAEVKELTTLAQTASQLVLADAIVFIDGMNVAFSIPSRGWKKREITEPDSEMVVRGPKEGFVESISINRSLLREKIKSPNLVFNDIIIGRQTSTCVSICYINGVVNKSVLEEVRRRLNNIDTDAILDSGYIEQFIEDAPFSLLSTVGNTEKPDVIAAKILEGRVAILCDGTPHVLTVPYLFLENLQTSEDYYSRVFISSLLRMLRILALGISIFLAPVYVALETYHQEMIPTVLLTTMMGASSHIPLPAFVEASMMTLMFQLLRESGTRLPRAVGPAISIVGALVLGDAAVKAGIVSSPMIIVIATTAICSFIIPSLVEFMAIYRFILLILAGFMGLFGITAGVYMLILHATALRSFGIPYCSPFAPADADGLKDSAIRFPLWSLKKRPVSIAKDNVNRQGNTRKE